jgi:hypothetical protein
MADLAPAGRAASTNSHYSTNDDNPTMLLPAPSFGIPASRPYTAATYVDLDAEVPVPPSQLGTLHPDDSQVSSAIAPPPEAADMGPEAVPQMPQTSLTFLLVSGRRRTMSFEPDTTVGRVKELVWNAWPSGGCCGLRPPFFFLGGLLRSYYPHLYLCTLLIAFYSIFNIS